jgi:hypothetical protein
MISRIHVNTTKLRNLKCTLVATSVILWSLECVMGKQPFEGGVNNIYTGYTLRQALGAEIVGIFVML